MGSGESKSEDAIYEQTENKLKNPHLIHKKCIYLTYDQYMSESSPLKTQNMYSENYIDYIGKDDSKISENLLKSIKKKLIKLNKKTGKEIPLPIYVSCAKKLEVSDSILTKIFSSSDECDSDIHIYEELKNFILPTQDEIKIEKKIEEIIKKDGIYVIR